MKGPRSAWQSRASFLIAAALVLALVCAPGASRAVIRAAEVVAGGGGAGQSASYKANDVIAQGPIGPAAEATGIRAYDGFYLVLPGINVPVEGAFFATLTESQTALLRWAVGSLMDIEGFNIYRSTSEDGPFERVNEAVLPANSPGSFEDASIWPQTTFWYELRALFSDGTEDTVGGSLATVTTGGRLVARLYPPTPNPCRGSTSFQLEIPDHVGPATLTIYNIRGQEVRKLVDGVIERGRRAVTWDGRDGRGRSVSSGVYLVRFEVDGKGKIQKTMVLR
jgi:hypothetical protein